MKNTVKKSTHFEILINEKVVGLTLRPMTYRMFVNIMDAVDGEDIEKVLQDPKPLQIISIAYALLDEASIKKIDSIKLKLSGENTPASPMHKMYYLTTDNTIAEGHHNCAVIQNAISENIIKNSPQSKKDKKKIFQLVSRNTSPWSLRRFTILSVLTIPIHLILFLMS